MSETQPTHALFIDDSGTREYLPIGREYDASITRYFIFGGILAPIGAARSLVPDIKALKRDAFGTAAVEIKSNWLRMPEQREARYLRPFGISEGELRDFVEEYYDTILRADFKLIAVVVDKPGMQAKYPEPWYPPAVAYDILLQRAQFELGGAARCVVTVDDISGATPKHNAYKELLKKQHERMLAHGSSLWRGLAFPSIAGPLKFVNSATSDMVQVADIAAYNVYRQFTDHGEEWEERGRASLTLYPYFGRFTPRFRKGPGGRIQGYGVIKYPDDTRVQWTAQEG